MFMSAAISFLRITPILENELPQKLQICNIFYKLFANTADALTFVLNSISNIDSVHYKHFVIFRFDNHFWNFLAFFEDLLILIL